MVDVRVKTPCIGVCSTGIGDRVCRGCKRFAHEVIHWNSYNNEEKLLIESRLSLFLSQCVRNKLQVTNAELLRTRLDAELIAYPEQRDHFCWAYCLLKTGASQIDEPGEYGLKIHAEFRDTPLSDLRRMIDEEYFTLSDAYYERYINTYQIA